MSVSVVYIINGFVLYVLITEHLELFQSIFFQYFHVCIVLIVT